MSDEQAMKSILLRAQRLLPTLDAGHLAEKIRTLHERIQALDLQALSQCESRVFVQEVMGICRFIDPKHCKTLYQYCPSFRRKGR
jgi:hypothetical protein